jgi:hypothetical protein
MALDTRYIPVIFPQGLFRDKDTGLPLRNGVIYTWEDESRTTPKPLFKISGTPPNYVYTELPNPLDLNSIGSFQDPNTNEDIAPYFFPYDSDDADANIQLYFYEVYSEGGKTSGVLQFTREGQPNLAEEAGPPEQQFENYIPNGQFLAHNDLAALPDGTKEAGEIRAATTVIAQGGWTFDRPNGSAAKDFVTFDTFPDTYDNPRFAVHIRCEEADAGNDFKDLRVEFRDVNKFASLSQEYTFAFSATDNDGTGLPIELILIKNYGTGGDSFTEHSIATFNITSAYPIPPANPYQVSFTFGLNTGKTIGDLNDDYLQLAIRFPVDSAFDVSLTDFSLAQGDITITGFPVQTDADTLTRSVAGWMPVPNPDGSDLYLPLQLTAEGLRFDDGEIGDGVPESQISVYVNSLHPTTNRLLPDGSQYETLAYSPLGIPFARLQSKYWDTTLNLPRYGTGPDFAIGYVFSGTITMLLSNNREGSVTATADGSAPTGFSFQTTHTGDTNYRVNGFCVNSPDAGATFFLENKFIGQVTPVSAGTSGFSIEQIQPGLDEADGGLAERTFITAVAASSLAGVTGKYWTFVSTDSAIDFSFYVWYKITTEADPAPGGTGIMIQLDAGDDAATVAEKTRASVNGFQVTRIMFNAAATLTAGDFWTFSTFDGSVEIDYYVWYTINGVGTDPAPANKIGIKVALTGSETANQVATKTQIAINMKYFAVPKWPGLFLRNIDLTGLVDRGNRYSLVPGVFGNATATYEYDTFQSHLHSFEIMTDLGDIAGGGGDIRIFGSPLEPANTSHAGEGETRGVNACVTYVIKY